MAQFTMFILNHLPVQTRADRMISLYRGFAAAAMRPASAMLIEYSRQLFLKRFAKYQPHARRHTFIFHFCIHLLYSFSLYLAVTSISLRVHIFRVCLQIWIAIAADGVIAAVAVGTGVGAHEPRMQ